MKKEDVDLEEMFENETGKEWHRTYPHIYTKWLEDKLTEQIVKNCSIPDVVVSEERAELCDNPNCEDGIVDRDYYGHPIYCQVCESHN